MTPIRVLNMVVGQTAVKEAVVHEMNDVSHAIGTVSQSYSVTGLEKARGGYVGRGNHPQIPWFRLKHNVCGGMSGEHTLGSPPP